MKSKMKLVWPLVLSILALLLYIGTAQGYMEDVDLRENDLGDGSTLTSPASPPTDCEQLCNEKPECTAWTYVKPGIKAENPVCYLKDPVPAAVPDKCCISGGKYTALYRFWNGVDHFYTKNCTGELVPPAMCDSAYSFERIAGYVATSGQLANIKTIPLYRVSSKKLGHHYYTTEYGDYSQKLQNPDYIDEGIEAYLAKDKLYPGTSEFRRMYNNLSGDYFLISTGEPSGVYDATKAGYNDDGRLGYIWWSGINPCQPPLDIVPRIFSFDYVLVDESKAKLFWSVKSGACCRIDIHGPDPLPNLNSVGSVTVMRRFSDDPVMPGATGTWELVVKCRKNQQARQEVKVAMIGGVTTMDPNPLTSCFFKVEYSNAMQPLTDTPCYVFMVRARSDECQGLADVYAFTLNATVTRISDDKFYDPNTCK